MTTRTVYTVLEQHWIYDDQDWTMHLPDAPVKAYATREQAEASLKEREKVNVDRDAAILKGYNVFDDENGYFDADIRFDIVAVEVEGA